MLVKHILALLGYFNIFNTIKIGAKTKGVPMSRTL